MSAVLNTKLMAFAVELESAINDALEYHSEFTEAFAPIGVHLHTIDGFTAQFLEEGIEFYPEVKEGSKVEVPVKQTYVTLGDIAGELERMKEQGMTKESVQYAFDRVFWE